MFARNWIPGLIVALVVLVGRQPTQAQTLSVIHSFTGVDGSTPEANLIVISSNLYGTTSYGGASGAGTVFKLTNSGVETVLHGFAGGPSDGADPGSGLILRKNNLYGTTFYGGADGYGTVFKVNPKTGNGTVLYNFAGVRRTGPIPRIRETW
jgi:uncharacterized repeat protein (TIGR03803 family)